jgi:hypothetical protein
MDERYEVKAVNIPELSTEMLKIDFCFILPCLCVFAALEITSDISIHEPRGPTSPRQKDHHVGNPQHLTSNSCAPEKTGQFSRASKYAKGQLH